jgi:hypothetical protein
MARRGPRLTAATAMDADARIATTYVLAGITRVLTVQVSLREHTLVPEPFLLVGLISAIRRVPVLTAEFDAMLAQASITPQQFAVELAVLAALILALAISLILLRCRRVAADARPARSGQARATMRWRRELTLVSIAVGLAGGAAGCAFDSARICQAGGGTYTGGTCIRWSPGQQAAQDACESHGGVYLGDQGRCEFGLGGP